MTVQAFEVRELPPTWCPRHGLPARWFVDGTVGVACRMCMKDELRAAEAVLSVDRQYHLFHDVKERGCPYCFPGAAA